MTTLAIRNARVVDPLAGTIVDGGVLVRDGVIEAVGDVEHGVFRKSDVVADAKGAFVLPGLVDVGAFAVDPAACAAGGITTTLLMPDQSPTLDAPALIREAAAGRQGLSVHPIAAATRGLAGTELAELALMRRAGACAVATGRRWIADAGVMHRLLAYAAALDLVVVAHAEDGGLTGGAVATDGETATRLGLASAPAVAEAMAVARDLALAAETGARIHFRQLTTAAAFDLVRRARAQGVRATCGISPAHLLLGDQATGTFRTFARLSPPLRSEENRRACIAALADGTIDVLCSGHDPRGPETKRLPFASAEPGAAGAATLLPLAFALVRDGAIDMTRLAALVTSAPAALFGLAVGTLAVGAPADLVIVDPDAPWRIDAERLPGRAGNTPFDGIPVHGKVLRTIKGGRPLG